VHCTLRRGGREGLSRGGAEGAEGKGDAGGGSAFSAAPRDLYISSGGLVAGGVGGVFGDFDGFDPASVGCNAFCIAPSYKPMATMQ
jgi:hypothetical protein